MSFEKQLRDYMDELDALENRCIGPSSNFRFDQLESRTLYAADPTAGADPALDAFLDNHPLPLPQYQSQDTIKIAFHPSDGQGPDGYLLDTGAAYGPRAGGFSYGWDVDNSLNVVDRNASLSYSERYDGVAAMQPGGQNLTWELAVPNGTYRVRVVAGDAIQGEHNLLINVEGKAAIRGQTDPYTNWIDNTAIVTVTDGKITISNGAGAKNNVLNFVEISAARDSDRMIAASTMAEGNDPATRNLIQWALNDGWTGFVQDYTQKELDQGYTRFLIHNPFGTTGTDRIMELGQYLDAKEAGLHWATDDFVQAWKPITAAGNEVIFYIGNNDPEFARLAAAGDIDGWNRRFWASVQPILDAGGSIAIDAVVLTDENSPIYAAVQKLHAMDVKVYVEARPMADRPWWNNYPSISMESWWQFCNNKDWAMPTDQLTGESLRWPMMPPTGYSWTTSGWLAPSAQQILREGDTAMVAASTLNKLDHVDMHWLLANSSPAPAPMEKSSTPAGPLSDPLPPANNSQTPAVTNPDNLPPPLPADNHVSHPSNSQGSAQNSQEIEFTFRAPESDDPFASKDANSLSQDRLVYELI